MPKTTNKQGIERDWKGTIRRLAVGYTRVSTTQQGERGTSQEAQRKAIATYADAMNYTLIEIFDDVASGVSAKSFHEREKLQAALDKAVEFHGVLIVWDWDRLSRHASFDKQVQKVFPDANKIVCAKDGLNMLEASRAAQFAHGEQTAANISRKTKEGMAKRRAQGATFGNPAISTDVQPLGVASWSNTRKDQDHAIANVLRSLPNPMELSRSQAAEILNQRGIRTLHKKEWTKSRVTEPLKRARAILEEEEKAKMAANPKFGIFLTWARNGSESR
ncbi:MAG: recombinase family protein [Roseovarius sp.]